MSRSVLRVQRAAPGWATPVAVVLALLHALACDSGVEGRLANVEALQEAGQFAETAEPLRRILRERPGSAQAHFLLGRVLLAEGRTTEAVPSLDRAASDPEYQVRAGLLLGTAFVSTQNFDEAIRAMDRVLAAEPDRPEALGLRAQAALGASRPESALADADRLLARLSPNGAQPNGQGEPGDAPARLLRASALQALGRLDEAEAVYRELQAAEAAAGGPVLEGPVCVVLAGFYDEHREDAERARVELEGCLEEYPTDRAALVLASDLYRRAEKPERATELWRRAVELEPDDVGLRAALAGLLGQQGRAEEAEAQLLEATRRGDTALPWAMLAELRRRQGNAVGAEKAVARAVELSLVPGGPNPERLRFLHADLLVELGELERAEALATAFEEPAYGDLILGRILLVRGDPQAALNRLDAGVERWPNNAGARFLAGQAAEQLGLHERALAEYREAVRVDAAATEAGLAGARLNLAVGNYGDAIGFAQHYAEARPDSGPEPYQIAARAALAMGRHAAARRTLEVLAGERGELLAATVERAALEREVSGPEAALALVRASGLDLGDPVNDPALRSILQDLVSLGRVDEAIGELRTARASRPDDPALFDLEGRALLRAGRTREAAESFERALAQGAEYGPALAGLATVAAGRGDAEEALALYERASGSGVAESGYLAAQQLIALGRLAEAQARLEEVVRQQPGNAAACNDLAWLLAEARQDLDRALALAGRAARLDPDADSFDTLGWVRLARDEPGEAVVAFRRAVSQPESSPGHRYHLGLALLRSGERVAALETFREALDSGPFPQAEAARAQIARLEGGSEGML